MTAPRSRQAARPSVGAQGAKLPLLRVLAASFRCYQLAIHSILTRARRFKCDCACSLYRLTCAKMALALHREEAKAGSRRSYEGQRCHSSRLFTLCLSLLACFSSRQRDPADPAAAQQLTALQSHRLPPSRRHRRQRPLTRLKQLSSRRRRACPPSSPCASAAASASPTFVWATARCASAALAT